MVLLRRRPPVNEAGLHRRAPLDNVAAQTGSGFIDDVRHLRRNYAPYHSCCRFVDWSRLSAASAGSPRQIHTKAVTIPAATLQLLWEGGTATAAIHARKWDFVVLQERRDLPTRDPERMHTYARRFDAEIKKNGAGTILFLTWVERGRLETQLRLNQAYFSLAKELDARVAPVGPAWQIALELAPGIHLHTQDGFHPTPTGTYLTACVFYLVMLGNQQQCPPIKRFGIWKDDVTVTRRAAFQASTTMP